MQVGSTDLQHANQELVVRLSISSIRSSRFQVRRELGALEELKRSILEKGLLHPIIVRHLEDSAYEVVAGNRRLEAFRSLGRSTIPGIVTDLNDREAFEVMITENIQRETLSPLEEARAFYAYVGPKEKNCYEYGKITELARRIGKSQEYVSNRMRLLRLPEALLRQLSSQKYFTASHAEELASLSDNPQRVEELSTLLLSEKMSVRELERAIPLIKSGVETKRAVELAKLESDLKVEWNYKSEKDDHETILMKRAELILKSALSYIDNAGADLEREKTVHSEWIEDVRLKVHDAISGVIRCRKMHNVLKNSPYRNR
ncbi:MAG: ParB/RepB/Spo0J family partition protein [Nitrososphaerota archaeon]|nr:ParB/RepB/Spo0J family partition protein [Nitrososphaerota archaeon]